MPERPKTITCQGYDKADGSHHECGVVVPVLPRGAVPKRCPECRRDLARDKQQAYQREYDRRRYEERKASVAARDDRPDFASPQPRVEPAPPVEEDAVASSQAAGVAVEPAPGEVCSAPGCAIPEPAHAGRFCDGHWRRVPLELRGTLLGSDPDSPAFASALVKALIRLRDRVR